MKATENKRPALKKLKKRPRLPQVLPSQCLNCESANGYQPKEVTQQIDFRDESFTITYTHLACEACGNAILSDPQLADRIKKVVAAYQRAHSLLTAEELTRRRNVLGYTSQRQLLAAAPEIKEATLKRLEGGQRAQDVSTDFVIRASLQRLEAIKRKERMRELTLPEPTQSATVKTPAKWTQAPWTFAKAACLTAAFVLPATLPTKAERRGQATKAPIVAQTSC